MPNKKPFQMFMLLASIAIGSAIVVSQILRRQRASEAGSDATPGLNG
jgi:hypothetical protein